MFCLPTLNEGCSNAIVEAIACGLPIISSNLPFNDDILDSSNALLVNPESVDDIASAIKQLMDNSDLRQKLAEGSNMDTVSYAETTMLQMFYKEIRHVLYLGM